MKKIGLYLTNKTNVLVRKEGNHYGFPTGEGATFVEAVQDAYKKLSGVKIKRLNTKPLHFEGFFLFQVRDYAVDPKEYEDTNRWINVNHEEHELNIDALTKRVLDEMRAKK